MLFTEGKIYALTRGASLLFSSLLFSSLLFSSLLFSSLLFSSETARRRVLSVLLTLTLAAGLLAVAPLTAYAATKHLNGTATAFVSGNGTNPDGTGTPDETPAALTGNTVNITLNADGTGLGIGSAPEVVGAITNGTDTVSGNTVNINTSGAIEAVAGGAGAGEANNNHVTIAAGSTGSVEEVIGALGDTGANNNTVTISGGSFSAGVIAGAASPSGNATNNIVTINAFTGSLNQVVGSIPFSTTYDIFTGNTLNLNNTSGTIDSVGLFEFINFGAGVTNAGINNLYLFDGQNVKLDVGSGNVDFSGAIQQPLGGVGSITKTGAGTLTLSGANTYTGTTTVSAGTLVFGPGSFPTGGGTITAATGATVTNNSGADITVNGTTVADGASYTAAPNPDGNTGTSGGCDTGVGLMGLAALALLGANRARKGR